MSTGEAYWMERAQSAEAKYNTIKESMVPTLDRVKQFKQNFGVRERSDGAIDIDFDKFVAALGPEASLELRGIIDEKYRISGDAGEKPRMRVEASEPNETPAPAEMSLPAATLPPAEVRAPDESWRDES